MLVSGQSFVSGFHLNGTCELVGAHFTEVVSRIFEGALKPTGETHSIVRAAEKLVEWVDLL